MKERLTIIKVGGAIVEDKTRLAKLLDDFCAVDGNKILVHGGGRRATTLAGKLDIDTKMVSGRRVTDTAMLEVVTMVYGGLINKNIVAQLQAKGINALGLTGADMNIIHSHKRPVKDGVDFGYVGDVDTVDGKRLSSIINAGVTPIIAPLTHDGKGNILNTNADTIASEAAKALVEFYDVTLIYCFEKSGVLRYPDDDNSVIPVINHKIFNELVSNGTISNGMIPKLENALAAVGNGVSKVIITLATDIDGKHGTVIK